MFCPSLKKIVLQHTLSAILRILKYFMSAKFERPRDLGREEVLKLGYVFEGNLNWGQEGADLGIDPALCVEGSGEELANRLAEVIKIFQRNAQGYGGSHLAILELKLELGGGVDSQLGFIKYGDGETVRDFLAKQGHTFEEYFTQDDCLFVFAQ